MSAPEIVTFGCRLNAFESEIIRDHVRAAGLADTIVFNTCTVTAEAERQARQAIRKARRKRPDARIVVTGCAAQIDPVRFAAMDEVDQVLGNAEKLRAESYRAYSEVTRTRLYLEALEEVLPGKRKLIADGASSGRRRFLFVEKGAVPPLTLIEPDLREQP